MLSFSASLIVYLIEMLIAYSVLSVLGERRVPIPAVFLIGAGVFGSGAVVNVLFANTVWINALFTLFMVFLFAVLCFRIRLRTAAACSVLMDVLSLAFEFVTLFALSALFGTELTVYNDDTLVLVIATAISKTLYFVSCMALLRFLRKTGSRLDRIPLSFYLYPVLSILAFLVFWKLCTVESLSRLSRMLLAYTTLALLALPVILFITYRHTVERDSEYLRMKSENLRLQTEKSYYDILEHQNQQLMLYAHDAKNHLAAIQSLSNDPQIDEYVHKLSAQLKSYTNNCHSGNRILDVLIDKYVTESELRGVSFAYDVRLCNLSGVEDIDVVAILGNLLDNALAAAEKSREKSMSLETTWRNSYGVIVITNSCDEAPPSSGERLSSTKEEPKLHGFGLKSVQRTLKKYQGDFSWDYDAENHRFVVTVMVEDGKAGGAA